MRVAVLIPCYNEEKTITQVVKECFSVLPKSEVWVIDNNSSDKTADYARKAGAFVIQEKHQGKGCAVRRGFAEVKADVYVMIDGDGTYDIPSIPKMIEKLEKEKLDMVTGVRISKEQKAYPKGHRFGNWLMTRIVHLFFGQQTNDMLSGLRVFSRRFVKSFPAVSQGFEIETELTIFSSSMCLPMADFDTPYYTRPVGSPSKLSTFKDGFKILKIIVVLVKEERPLLFFSGVALGFFILSLLCAIPVILTYLETGLVPRIPTTVLSVGFGLCSGVSFAIAVILDSLKKVRQEVRRFAYLNFKEK
ncbi:MAG: glycosyltransferase [Alphaproteobacteria bacterium]